VSWWSLERHQIRAASRARADLSDLAGRLSGMTLDERARRKLLEGQRGVISRSQALEMGVSRSGVRHRLQPGGRWQSLLPGVYLTVTGQPTSLQRDMAALLYAGPVSAITGPSALLSWGMTGVQARDVDVLVPDSCQRASRKFVRIRRTRRMPAQIAYDRAIGYVFPARAVVDTVRGLRDLGDVRAIVAGAVQQRVCRIELLAAELPAGPVAGTGAFRAVLAEVAAGVRSGPEGDLRHLLTTARLPMPLFNCSLRLGGTFLARPDAYWPQHGVVVEVDSWQWHSGPDAWAGTLRRHNRLEAAGLRVLHFSPRQIRTEPRDVIAQITAALAHGQPAAGISVQAAA
jgi:very-short-patch-repair endonuclease